MRNSTPPTAGGNETPRQPAFVTTHWSVVLNAGRNDTERARESLERLCRTYWFPLYADVRRRGHSPADAEDLTQGFFAQLLKLNSLAAVQREKGRFRSFLLGAMNHFLADQWDRASAQKRGAERTIPLDTTLAETRYQGGSASELPPDRLFERQWAMTLLDTVLQQLHQEYQASGRGELFLGLRFAITGDKSDVPYAELAGQLDMTEPAVRVAVHRLKRRYREMLRREIADTVADESEIAAELNYLRRVLST